MSDYHFDFEKQPREEITRDVDFAKRYEFKNGETIAVEPDIDITCDGQAVADIFVASTFDDTKAFFRLKGGEHGKNYKISILVTTNEGHKREADGLMMVREK